MLVAGERLYHTTFLAKYDGKHRFGPWFIDGEIGLVRENLETDPPKGGKHRVVIGEQIRRMRKDRGLTTVDLGRICHCSQKFLIEVENGNLLPSLPMIYRLARALDVDPATLQD